MAGSHHQSCHNSIRLRQGQTIKFNLSNIRIETDAEDMTWRSILISLTSEVKLVLKNWKSIPICRTSELILKIWRISFNCATLQLKLVLLLEWEEQSMKMLFSILMTSSRVSWALADQERATDRSRCWSNRIQWWSKSALKCFKVLKSLLV